MREPLAALHHAADQLLRLHDHTILDVVLAVLVANRLQCDPTWLAIVGPPSTGKTEILTAASHIPATYLLSTLTKNTLISGQQVSDPSAEASLLPRLRDKTLILKDFTTILTMHREDRAAIFSILREVYDGKVTKVFGTGRQITWQGKMGLLAGVTPIFDTYLSVQAVLGERLLVYRPEDLDFPTRHATALHALYTCGRERELREQLGRAFVEAYRQVLEHAQEVDEVLVGPSGLATLGHLADVVAHGRVGVLHDQYKGQVLYQPQAEGPARLSKQLYQLLMALTLSRGKVQAQEDELAVIRRVARDSMQPLRCQVLRVIHHKPSRAVEIARSVGRPYSTVKRELEDCALLGLVTKNRRIWAVSPEFSASIIESRIF